MLIPLCHAVKGDEVRSCKADMLLMSAFLVMSLTIACEAFNVCMVPSSPNTVNVASIPCLQIPSSTVLSHLEQCPISVEFDELIGVTLPLQTVVYVVTVDVYGNAGCCVVVAIHLW